MSKESQPKHRLGQGPGAHRNRIIKNLVVGLAVAGGAYAAYHYGNKGPAIEVPVEKVRLGEFVISVKTRGEIRSVNSMIITAPQVPGARIVKLAESGKPIKKGDVVVEFDAAQQEQALLERNTTVRTVDSEIVQTKASHRIIDEQDGMNLMTADYNLKRSKLDASKAEVVSEIEGAKSRIDVTISEGELNQVKTTANAHKITQKADVDRLQQRKDKTVRDMERAKSYLSKMVLVAPQDGMVNLLPNFRAQGSFGSAPPPFKEGDTTWTGAPIAEIPDLTNMRIELKLDEVDRGKVHLGQKVRVTVDAIREKSFEADLDWISPIAAINFRGMGLSEKTFPARATLKAVDPRLRPGMSASAEIIIESSPQSLLIPARASFTQQGKPAVWVQKGEQFEVRHLEVGKRNENYIVVLKGLKAGEQIALENPAEAAKKARKL